MAAKRSDQRRVKNYSRHQMIEPPNRLRGAAHASRGTSLEEAVARAEQSLKALSGEFPSWMQEECKRLAEAYEALVTDNYAQTARDRLYRAAHDIRGQAATLGYPAAGDAADSLCRILDYAPVLRDVPPDLLESHVNAVIAIVRESRQEATSLLALTLSETLRSVADDYLIAINQDRPEHLKMITSPSIVPTQRTQR